MGQAKDPNYSIVARRGNQVFSKNFPAESLAVSSLCQFYASGNSNLQFNMRRKFVVAEKGIKETQQPLYLVDMKCPASAPATLTAEKCGKGSVVATVPKGAILHVLASEWFKDDGDWDKVSNCGGDKASYLVATPFGLIGWVENEAGDIYGHPGKPLSCIFVNGD